MPCAKIKTGLREQGRQQSPELALLVQKELEEPTLFNVTNVSIGPS